MGPEQKKLVDRVKDINKWLEIESRKPSTSLLRSLLSVLGEYNPDNLLQLKRNFKGLRRKI